MKAVFRKLWSLSSDRAAPASDPWVQRTLGVLDPSRSTPSYWFEFHGGVMRSAGAELARRRRQAEITVSEVVSSWSRGLVPVAMAAALAAFLLLRPDPQGPPPLRLEEILWGSAGAAAGAELSVVEVSSELAAQISFAVDVY